MRKQLHIIFRLVMFCCILLFVSQEVSAQITFSVKNQTIRQTIRVIEKKADYSFFYTDKLPGLDQKISLKVDNESIDSVLEKVFKGSPISYKIESGKQVVLTLKTEQNASQKGDKKTKEKFKQEHPEVARYAKATAYLAKHPDDKDSTQKELQEEQETLLEEIAALKIPLTEVQEDLKKLRDIRYWVRKATPGTEESKEPPKKQPLKEVLQDKADEKKAQRTAPVQTKHKQQDMEL